jgi:hypothetical protein
MNHDQTIFRAQKNRNYVTINKEFLQNTVLSWQAKGILGFLLTLPDDWEINLKHLSGVSRNGIDATRAAMNELIKAGYIHRFRDRNEKGVYEKIIYHVYETPQLENPEVGIHDVENRDGNPQRGNPDMDNPTQLNNNCTKEERLNNKDIVVGARELATTTPPPIEFAQRFNPQLNAPTIAMIQEYAASVGYLMDEDTAQRFLDTNQMTGWKMSKGKKIEDWRPAVRLWRTNRNYDTKVTGTDGQRQNKEAELLAEVLEIPRL